MTKDEPMTGIATRPMMEQGVEILRINLDQPLTDQLVKHSRFAPLENDTWNRELGDPGKQGRHWDDNKQKYPSSNGYAASQSFEIMDLAMRKNSGDVGLNSAERDKRAFGSGGSDKTSSSGAALYNHSAMQSSDFDKFYKGSPPADYVQNGNGVKDLHKSDAIRGHNNVNRGLSKCSPSGMSSSKCSPVLTNTAPSSAQSGLPPPLLRTNYDGGHAGAKMSAFQPVENHLRDQTMPALYKSHPYSYGLPAMPPNTAGLFDYPSLSHHLLQPSEHHRSLIQAPSSSQTVSAGTALSPYVLYSDNLMTHQLEVLWQRKYPHHPVPPVWMLYQYSDELLRGVTSREMNPVPRGDSSSSYKVGSMSNPAPVVPAQVVGSGTVPADRKRARKEPRERERFGGDNKEAKTADGPRSKEGYLSKPRNDSKDRKEWGKQPEMDQQRREPNNQNGNAAVDWHHRLDHRQLDSHLQQQQTHQQQQQQRREMLVDESASSAYDAVNQHFQESLLRLASSQNHVNTSPREAAGITGQGVLSRNHLDDPIMIEKQENIHGNGNHGSWKDGRYAKPDQTSQYRMSDNANSGGFSRLLGANVTTQAASRNNNKVPPGDVSFDIYGYHLEQGKDYNPEKFRSVTRGDVCSGKPEKADSRLKMCNQSTPNSSQLMTASRKQQAFLAAEPGKDVKDVHQDFRSSFSASAKGGEKPTSRTVSAKQLNGMNLSTGSQSMSSPIPGSIVKDSRLGPSRLIARSPKPLPNVFYNPLDSGFEPVQPCQVSIEPVERWTNSCTWAPSRATDSYPPGLYMHPGSLPSGFSSFQQTSSASFPTETYSKIQQGLIPNPLYFTGMCDLKQDNYSSLPHRSSVPDFRQTQTLAKMSPLGFESSESRAMPGKPGRKEEDARESAKKMRGTASVPRLVSAGRGDDSTGGLQRARLDSFKAFVEQAVYNAFIEDSDEGNGREKMSSMTKLIADLEMERDVRDISTTGGGKSLTGSASKRSSQASPVSDRSGADTGASLPSESLKISSDRPLALSAKVLPSTPSAMDWCNGEPSRSTVSTASSITAASDLSERALSTLDMAAFPPSSPAHPSQITPSPLNFPLPPSPPRAPSGAASLHLKKAWLLRYSDNDQKPLSDASSSSFRDEPDNQSSDCSKCSFAEKSSRSPCDSDVVDVAKYAEIQPVLISDILNVEKGRKQVSSCASEYDFQENGNDAVKIKHLKRKAASEPIRARCPKRARDSASSPGSNKSELINGHKDNRETRSKYSTRLAKMTERSALNNSPQVASRGQECYDPKNTEENDDSCSPGQSDSETRTSRLRKNRANHVQARDHKDSDGRSAVQPKKTGARIFLQDAACGEIDQRLTKCRECKAPQSQKNKPNTTNICKFYVFRKLRSYNKGVVSVAGFSEPSDAEKDDVDLWMPLQSKNSHLTPVQAHYAITHLKECFLFLLEHETNAEPRKSKESDKSSDVGKTFWRRPIEGVQETCDICDAVVFDVHWTCARCGFVVCVDCYEGYGFTKDSEDDDDQKGDENDWPTCCASRQSHEPDDLTMTRIIPCDVLSVMRHKLQQALDTEGDIKEEVVPLDRPKTENPEQLPNQSFSDSVGISAASVDAENQTTECGIPRSSVPCGDSEEVQQTAENSVTVVGASDAATVDSLGESGCNGASTDSQEIASNGKLSSIPRVILSRSDAEINRTCKSIENRDQPTCDLGRHGDASCSTFVGQRVLHLVDGTDDGTIDLFQSHWKRSLPVVVTSCNKRFQSNLWKPEVFAKRFSHLKVDVVSCLTGAVHRFPSMEKFWTSSKHLLSSSGSRSTSAGLLQFKEWPLSDDWTGPLNDLHLDLRQALPFHCYTLTSGPFNLASHLPEFFPQPDLVTRIIVGHGNIAQNQVTLSKLQMNPVDFVSVVMHAENKDSESESFAANIVELVKDSGVNVDMTLVTKRPETIVAVWQTYLPQDTGKIKSFLEKIHTGRASSPKGSSRDSSTDVGCYLDSALQEKLIKDFGVQPSVIVQHLGDAVFIPAMAFYQVKVIQDCLLVSREFISPESIRSSFDKSLQPRSHRSQSKEKHDRQNHLQIKNLVYHTVKDCIATLSAAKS